jgi:hypothetical protein
MKQHQHANSAAAGTKHESKFIPLLPGHSSGGVSLLSFERGHGLRAASWLNKGLTATIKQPYASNIGRPHDDRHLAAGHH